MSSLGQKIATLSLLQRFSLAGGAVLAVTAAVVGSWVSARIEDGVVSNAAGAAALYMESFLSPVARELGSGEGLSTQARAALDATLEGTPLGEQVVSYKIWRPDGLIEHASNPALIGQTFELSDDQRAAWSGAVAASIERPDDEDVESAAERALGLPLLEIYSPIRAPWSGEIIAVAEFYEIATDLEQELAQVRQTSWLIVAATYLASGIALFGIVRAGNRTILRQQARLEEELASKALLAEMNAGLRERATGAAARAAAQAERQLRQVSTDLHDGPGQNLSLAMLRLDKLVPPDAGPEAEIIKTALTTAINEIRSISRGISLPELAGADLPTVIRQALEGLAGADAVTIRPVPPGELPPVTQSTRIATYRFVQETVSNALRHAPGAAITITVNSQADQAIELTVSDDGPGFDSETMIGPRADGGDGLPGLRDRIESLGGDLVIRSMPGRGTEILLRLPIHPEED